MKEYKKVTIIGDTSNFHLGSKLNYTEFRKLITVKHNILQEIPYDTFGVEFIPFSKFFYDIKKSKWWKGLENSDILKKYQGIIVPGGFGSRDIEGKIVAIKYARENQIPYFGLCYGMQLATVEFARNVLGYKRANTTEIDPKTEHPVIHIMPDQEKKMLERNYGATMRLGAWECKLKDGSEVRKLYGKSDISERHRHRYEFNNKFRPEMEKAGLSVAGTSPDGKLVEVIELKNHPFFIGTQFHPELKSRPLDPHPLFVGFVKAASQVKA